jgi:hypothetical protein
MENLEKALNWLNENKNELINATKSYHASHTAYEMLEEVNKKFELDYCGIEGWSAENGNKGVNYLNGGDPYVPTIFALASFNEIEFKIATIEEIMNSDWFLPLEDN